MICSYAGSNFPSSRNFHPSRKSFVMEWATFDAELFSIPPSEAGLMDPQQRLLLEETAGLLTSDATAGPAALSTAIMVAIAKLGEPPVVAAGAAAAVGTGSSFIGTGRALSAAAGRLSYVYGLKVRQKVTAGADGDAGSPSSQLAALLHTTNGYHPPATGPCHKY